MPGRGALPSAVHSLLGARAAARARSKFNGSKFNGSRFNGSKVQRFKGSRFKVQRFKVQRFKVQRFKVQRFKVQGSTVQRFKVQRFNGSRFKVQRFKVQRFNGSGVHSAPVTLGDSPAGDPMLVVNPIALQIAGSAQGVQLSWPAGERGYLFNPILFP